jgi:hypothetical protein
MVASSTPILQCPLCSINPDSRRNDTLLSRLMAPRFRVVLPRLIQGLVTPVFGVVRLRGCLVQACVPLPSDSCLRDLAWLRGQSRRVI